MNPERTLLVARAAIWRTKDKQQALFGRRPGDSKNYPGQWEFPGGKIDKDENPSTAARREAREETRLAIIRYLPNPALFYQYIMPRIEGVPDEKQSPYLGWLIKTWVTEAIAYPAETLFEKPPEHDEFRWLTLEEALQLQLTPQTDFALPELRSRQNIRLALLGLDPLPPIEIK